MSRILVITGNYHFGDNAGVFQDALYIGHLFALPLHKTWINNAATNVSFFFTTHDVETWGTWDGHKVSINGNEIGHLKDPANTYGRNEEFQIDVPLADFNSYLGGNDNFTLQVELEKQPAMPGLADDFVLTRVETADLAVRVGWQ